MAIGLLTGTFDPVHRGHIAIARAALEQCGLDEVWFLVNPDPTHKLSRAGLGDRVAMVELALADQPGLSIGRLSPEQRQLSHNLSGLERLTSGFFDCQFEYIVGMDTLLRLDTWKDVQSVVQTTAYIVAHRPETPLDGLEQLKARLGDLASSLRVRVIDLPELVDASSTQVRERLAKGELAPELDPRVHEYITRRVLYSN